MPGARNVLQEVQDITAMIESDGLDSGHASCERELLGHERMVPSPGALEGFERASIGDLYARLYWICLLVRLHASLRAPFRLTASLERKSGAPSPTRTGGLRFRKRLYGPRMGYGARPGPTP